jgi:hypothetical protein
VIGRATTSSASFLTLRKDTNHPAPQTSHQNPYLKLIKPQNEAPLEIEEPHMIPETAIIKNLRDLRHEKFYLVVYIRAKTE